MKHTLMLLILLALIASVSAQTPDWIWAQRFGSGSDDYVHDLAVDQNDYVYLVGAFSGTISFAETTLTSAGSADILVVKLDPQGNPVWATKAGGTNNDYGYSVAVAPNGDVFVHGTFFDTAYFGSSSVTSGGQNDIFVAKLNSSGQWQWAISASTTATDMAGQIAVDANGDAYVTGNYWGNALFGTISVPTIGYKDIYVAKVSSGGSWLWVSSGGGTSSDEGWGIAVDGDGFVYISGSIFGSGSLGPYSYTSNHYDAFVAKLSSTGEWLWMTKSTGSSPEYAENLILDSAGNIYIGGFYYTDGYFAPAFSGIYPPELGVHTMYVAKLSSGGVWQWVKAAGAYTSPGGYSSQNNKVKSLAVDSEDNLWLSGIYEGNAHFEGLVIPFIGSIDGFLAQMDSSGNWLQVERFGGASTDWAYAITVDSEDNSYVGGSFSGNAGFGETTFNSAGGFDGFFAKFGHAGTASPQIIVNPGSIDFGSIVLNQTASISLEIGNSGSAPLNLTSALCSSPYFVPRLPGDLSFPIELGPEETQHLYIDFTPLLAQDYNASLIVFSSDPVTPAIEIPLSGSGLALSADFSATPLSGEVPLQVQFTDQSVGAITEWLWDFGDGASSDLSNPLHTYTQAGIYTVSLTVFHDNAFTTFTREDYIEVNASPLILSPQSPGLDYGIVWLGSSATRSLSLQSVGNAPLTIELISLGSSPSAFSIDSLNYPIVLDPGNELVLDVVFSPVQSMLYQDMLTVYSDAENQPVLDFYLSGEGRYIAPAQVQNVNVEINATNALITWDPVTQSETGSALVPDRYIVLYNETPYEDDQYYYFLASTVDNSFTHQEVALFRDQMFYRVVAVKFYRNVETSLLDSLSPADRMTWKDLQQRLQR